MTTTYTETVYRVLLLSGGLDSTALLVSEYPDLAVFVDYGQPAAEQECLASGRMAERFDVEWRCIRLPNTRLARMADAVGVPGPRVVPARNALLIAAAANHCDGPGVVLFGAHQGDAKNYPDCRPNFVNAMALALGEAYGISVQAPLLSKTRQEISEMLKGAGIEFSACWSCYSPTDDGKPCGECDSCRQGPT